MKGLPPGVQHGGDANAGTQVPGIGGDGEQCLGRRAEQQIVDHRLVLVSDWSNLGWQREDQMEIADWQQVGLDERGITFRYKDYRSNGRERFRSMTLAPSEFIRRFLLHVLPKGFHRIRHYGLLASATCKANIARARELIAPRQWQ